MADESSNSGNPPNASVEWIRARVWVLVPIAIVALLIYYWPPIRAHMQSAAINLEMQGKRIPCCSRRSLITTRRSTESPSPCRARPISRRCSMRRPRLKSARHSSASRHPAPRHGRPAAHHARHGARRQRLSSSHSRLRRPARLPHDARHHPANRRVGPLSRGAHWSSCRNHRDELLRRARAARCRRSCLRA